MSVKRKLTVPLGGVWADRLPRQVVMLASDVVRALAQAAIAVLLLTHHARIWELVALAAVYGTADAFFTPAAVGLTPLTVSAGRLQQANALRGLSGSVAGILGPAIGGLIVATTSPGVALAFDSGTFLVSAVSLALLPIAAAFFVTSIGMPLGNALWNTTLQQHIPERSISRVSAFDYMGTFAVGPIGYVLIGALASRTGTSAVLVGAAGLGALATLATLSLQSVRHLARADLHTHPTPRSL